MPTPVARRKFIKDNVLAICVPRPHTALRDRLSTGAALVGRLRDTGAILQVAEADAAVLQHYPARLRQAATLFLAAGGQPAPLQVMHADVEIVGRYDATLRRIERIDRSDSLAEWLAPEPLPLDARDAGPEHLMRLWDDVVAALALPTKGDAAVLRRSIKQLAFLAEDYQASGLTRGADELSMLAMLLESQTASMAQPKTE